MRVEIADVLVGEDREGARIAVLVRGDCDIAIDLDRAKIVDKDDVHYTAKILLPLPYTVRPRVDHKRTSIYRVEKTTWVPWKDPREKLFKTAMKRAQELIEDGARKPDMMRRAQRHAEHVIKMFYKQFGWDVTVKWQG